VATSSMIKKNPVLPLRYSKSLINKNFDCYCPTFTVNFWTVTVWPLLKFLTISGVIELQFKRNLWRWKGKTCSYKFNDWEDPSSSSKIIKIAHQQKLRLLLSNCYCQFLNCYYLTYPQIFNYIWSYRTPIQAKFVALKR
jgi:hypothetical protein